MSNEDMRRADRFLLTVQNRPPPCGRDCRAPVPGWELALLVPLARLTESQKERELRRALWETRDAIDRYKDTADRGGFIKWRFLRRIPVDPMTGTTDWGLRSMQDDPESDSWGGQNVFDVYTKSQGTGLDGTRCSLSHRKESPQAPLGETRLCHSGTKTPKESYCRTMVPVLAGQSVAGVAHSVL